MEKHTSWHDRSVMKKEPAVYSACVAYFLAKYEQQAGFPYVFTGIDGKALKSLLKNIETIKKDNISTFDTFHVIIDNLPAWVINDYYTLSGINKHFNTIIKQIKDGRKTAKNKNRSNSSDFIKQQLDILQS